MASPLFERSDDERRFNTVVSSAEDQQKFLFQLWETLDDEFLRMIEEAGYQPTFWGNWLVVLDKYEVPRWLASKEPRRLKSMETVMIFEVMRVLTPYERDTIGLNTSFTYTLFKDFYEDFKKVFKKHFDFGIYVRRIRYERRRKRLELDFHKYEGRYRTRTSDISTEPVKDSRTYLRMTIEGLEVVNLPYNEHRFEDGKAIIMPSIQSTRYWTTIFPDYPHLVLRRKGDETVFFKEGVYNVVPQSEFKYHKEVGLPTEMLERPFQESLIETGRYDELLLGTEEEFGFTIVSGTLSKQDENEEFAALIKEPQRYYSWIRRGSPKTILFEKHVRPGLEKKLKEKGYLTMWLSKPIYDNKGNLKMEGEVAKMTEDEYYAIIEGRYTYSDWVKDQLKDRGLLEKDF